MGALQLFDLTGKTAMVSGGGEGLGRSMALGLAEAGAKVVLFSRKVEKCESTAREIELLGGCAMAVRCDIGRQEDVDRLMEQTLEKFEHIDILVNNAGRSWGGSPEDITLEDWQKVIDLNVNATFRITRAVGLEMIKRKSGKIINISSYSGSRGTDPLYLNAIAYNVSKGALETFTKDLAVKWAQHGINVNCIAPGWFPTKMTTWSFEKGGDAILARTPMKRFGKVEEIMGITIFLASAASDFMTGQVIGLDGGLSAW